MNFSDKLRALIEERDLTQKQVAADLNIAPSTVGGYVQGSSEPDFETLSRLAKYFDVSADYLLGLQTGFTATLPEEELLRVFGSMTAEQQMVYIEQGKVFVKSNHKKHD
ncbi:MAG: helix-turn-helix domain-containing protein [Oscillospiraceae bacterium]|nr:helix-turn-helix domain-containing protein [Oscillospiraceae bacterium]